MPNGHHDTQHKDTQHNEIQHNDTQHKGHIRGTQHKRHSATTMLCHLAECHYAECHILFIIMLNVIILSVIMLNVAAPPIELVKKWSNFLLYCLQRPSLLPFGHLDPGVNVIKPFFFRQKISKRGCG